MILFVSAYNVICCNMITRVLNAYVCLFQIILVYAIDKQRRLMATEQNKRRVSIPLSHPLKVHIFIEGGKCR